MHIQGAVIKEQGVTFAIASVKPHVLTNTSEAHSMTHSLQYVFGAIPIILMAQDSRGRPQYYGRQDIARFLSKIPFRAIPWREYSIR